LEIDVSDIELRLQRRIVEGLANVEWSNTEVRRTYLLAMQDSVDQFIATKMANHPDSTRLRGAIHQFIGDFDELAGTPGFDLDAWLADTRDPAASPPPAAPSTEAAAAAPVAAADEPAAPASRPVPAAAPLSPWIPAFFSAIAAIGVTAFVMPMFASDCPSSSCFDSGWVGAEVPGTKSLVIDHPLGVLPRSISVWFSPDASSKAFPVMWRWDQGVMGNPMAMQVSPTQVTLVMYQSDTVPLAGTYRPDSSPETYKKGFFKVVVRK
jgi:hypothetical protein